MQSGAGPAAARSASAWPVTAAAAAADTAAAAAAGSASSCSLAAGRAAAAAASDTAAAASLLAGRPAAAAGQQGRELCGILQASAEVNVRQNAKGHHHNNIGLARTAAAGNEHHIKHSGPPAVWMRLFHRRCFRRGATDT